MKMSRKMCIRDSTYTYKKKGLFSSKSTEFPTEPGTYTQTAQATGNYSCEKITRTIVIY